MTSRFNVPGCRAPPIASIPSRKMAAYSWSLLTATGYWFSVVGGGTLGKSMKINSRTAVGKLYSKCCSLFRSLLPVHQTGDRLVCRLAYQPRRDLPSLQR